MIECKSFQVGTDVLCQILKEYIMFRFLLCLFGLHGATEIDYTIDDEEIIVCRSCLKVIK